MLASRNIQDQIGQTKVHLSLVDSTNNYAANLLKLGKAKTGTVILADEQTNGRGQRGEVWQSEPGMNLQFSIIWVPENLSISNQKYLNIVVSLGLVFFLEKKGIKAKIKWPNDILVKNKKICGVLIENQIQGFRISSSIIGIGLNVNQQEFENFPATSVRNELGQFLPTEQVLDGLLHTLNNEFQKLNSTNIDLVEKCYYSFLLGYECAQKFKDDQGEFTGEILGVDANGNLQVVKNGMIRSYGIKELRFIL